MHIFSWVSCIWLAKINHSGYDKVLMLARARTFKQNIVKYLERIVKNVHHSLSLKNHFLLLFNFPVFLSDCLIRK